MSAQNRKNKVSKHQLRKQLALATCSLIASSLHATEDWEVDATYLSYTEADGRVAVNKTLIDIDKTLDDGSFKVGLVYDAMSGASPTGAVRSSDSLVTFSSPSSRSGFSAGSNADNSLNQFDDTRVQLSATREQELNRLYSFSYGGVISNEEDFNSLGTTLGLKKEALSKLSSIDLGFAFTSDSIYRSFNEDTPVPLGNTESSVSLAEGQRNTYDGLLGYTRVLNPSTVAQVNLTLGLSQGYHSDPYKIISAADENNRVVANFHDSRPDSRQRTSLYTKVVHQLANSEHAVQFSYRLYQDDWGIQSHTVDTRYHYTLSARQYLEPHLRFYRQSAADFYQRKLNVNAFLDPVLPADGFASADYRLDEMNSMTVGLKYGFKYNRNTQIRLRAEYLQQKFSTAEFDTNDAVILQSSLKYRF